jgi:Bacterial Ig-like domain
VVRTTSILAFLLILVIAGCGREQAPATLPVVVTVTPANGATGVPVASLLTATFNKAMNPTSINTSTFTVVGPTGAAVTGTVTYSGTTATFTPATLLATSSKYTATITTGVMDAIGTALASNFVWSFTTGTAPTVISTNPVNGAVSIPINRKITATFSEAMNPATVTSAGVLSLMVTTGGALVPGTATFVNANNTVIFSPTANLLPNTHHRSPERCRQWSGSKLRIWFYHRRYGGPHCTDPHFHRTGLGSCKRSHQSNHHRHV